MLRLLIILPFMFLAGCVSLGLSQSQSEQDYTIAATGSDILIISGKVTGDVVGQICLADLASYKILISTRNIADGVKSYAPADNAHITLHSDGAKLNSSCVLTPL